jgi:hypothetical protein
MRHAVFSPPRDEFIPAKSKQLSWKHNTRIYHPYFSHVQFSCALITAIDHFRYLILANGHCIRNGKLEYREVVGNRRIWLLGSLPCIVAFCI